MSALNFGKLRFGINLRGDLAKLSDTEIGEEMDRLISERQSLYDSIPSIVADWKWLYKFGFLFPFGRGLMHSRLNYKLKGGYFGPFKHAPFGALYRYDCEIKDILEEIERRVEWKKSHTGNEQ